MNLSIDYLITKESDGFYHLHEKRRGRDSHLWIGRYSGSEEPIRKAEEYIERRGGTITIDLRG
jgi:hypothetical protein